MSHFTNQVVFSVVLSPFS